MIKTAQTRFIELLAARGAALTLYPERPIEGYVTTAVVDVVPVETNGRVAAIMLYEPFRDYTGGIHCLECDEVRVVNTRNAELIRGGRIAAALGDPDPVDHPEVAATLDAWYRHLEDPENRRRHERAITDEYSLHGINVSSYGSLGPTG
jgi:hypothetical protein